MILASPSPPRRHETDLFSSLRYAEPDERARALEAVVSRASRSLDARRRIWSECDGMTYHDQWGELSEAHGSWQPRGPAPANKVVRIEENLIYPLLEQRTSLLIAEKLNLRVRAGASEGKDAAAAKGGDKLLRYAWEHLDMEGHRLDVAEGCSVLGNWFLHPMWDEMAGPLVTDERGYMDESGEPLGMEATEKPGGDVAVESLSPYEVIADRSMTNRNPGMWIAAHRMVATELLRNNPRFDPEQIDDIAPEGSLGRSGSEYAARRRAMHPRSNDPWGSTTEASADRESVLVTTLYVRRTAEYLRGRMFIIAAGKMLYEGDNPMYARADEPSKASPDWPYPIFPFRDHPVPGAFYGQGVVVRAIAPQKAINGAISKAVLQIRKVSHPTLIHPKGIDFKKTDEPDQQVAVNPMLPAGSIYYLKAPPLSQETFQLIAHSFDTMQLIFGVNESTAGSLPSADTSGRAIEALQKSDNSRLAPMKIRRTRQLAMLMTYVLRLYQRHCEVGRQVEITGENRKTEVLEFNEATLQSGLDVVMFDDLMRPNDPARRMVWAQTLGQLGIFRPEDPRHRAALAQLIGFADVEGFEESTLRGDYEVQLRENLRIYAGEEVTANFWEDDQEHLAAMTSDMNTDGWRTATTPNDEDDPQEAQRKAFVRQRWMAHYQEHLTQQDRKSMAQMAQMPQPGAPGQGAPQAAQIAGGQPAGAPA